MNISFIYNIFVIKKLLLSIISPSELINFKTFFGFFIDNNVNELNLE